MQADSTRSALLAALATWIAEARAAATALRHASATVDALCFQFDAPTLAALTTCSPAYVCEGPLLSPPNSTTAPRTRATASALPDLISVPGHTLPICTGREAIEPLQSDS